MRHASPQTGALTGSPLGGEFDDEPEALKLKHDRKAREGSSTAVQRLSPWLHTQPHKGWRCCSTSTTIT